MLKKMAIAFTVTCMLVGLVLSLTSFPHVHAAAGDCSLIVPNNPLTATGLSTPYRLQAPCHESDPNTRVFVQGAILNTDTGALSIYNPLVIDQGTLPAVAPIPPVLPTNSIVALWFGSSGNVLTLDNAQGCKQGMGQFAYCNAPTFFEAVNNLHIVIPALGVGNDGQICPTARDFSIIDQDQSDNVATTYLLTADGRTAQNTAANRVTLGVPVIANGSDERLVTLVDKALGCTPFMAPDVADNGNLVSALPLNELQAARYQAAPIARVPLGDPFVGPNVRNLLVRYRLGVDQNPGANASTAVYCQHLLAVAPARLKLDRQFTLGVVSPTPAVGNNLFTFLAARFVFTYGADGLNCMDLLGKPDPITLTLNGDGVAIDAQINV